MTKSKHKMQKVYDLLEVTQPDKLFEKYLIEDQKIVTSKVENYFDKKLLINKIKNVLENIDARFLTKEEKLERRHILWLWYHHAISYAVWGKKDRSMALRVSSLALRYQPKDHPNTITKLLYLLIRGHLAEAEEWSKNATGEEKKTAKELILFYKEGGFF